MESVTTRKRSCRVSVHWWGWISHEGDGVLNRIVGQLDGQIAVIIIIIIIIITAIWLLPGGTGYLHILQNVTVPSVLMLYPDVIIQIQQDHSSIHDSRVVQERLPRQDDV